MIRVTLTQPAPDGARFEPGAFDHAVGRTVPVTLDGAVTGAATGTRTGTVAAAVVSDDGAMVCWTIELPDGDPAGTVEQPRDLSDLLPVGDDQLLAELSKTVLQVAAGNTVDAGRLAAVLQVLAIRLNPLSDGRLTADSTSPIINLMRSIGFRPELRDAEALHAMNPERGRPLAEFLSGYSLCTLPDPAPDRGPVLVYAAGTYGGNVLRAARDGDAPRLDREIRRLGRLLAGRRQGW